MHKKELLEYLRTHDLMSLATSSQYPANCIVYYGARDDFHFFIVTSPLTEHGKNIEANSHVACTIVDTSQHLFTTAHRIGLQMKGTAQVVTKEEEVKEGLHIWSKGDTEKTNTFYEGIISKQMKSRVYEIVPAEIKWFNEELFGKEGKEIYTFD